MFLRKRVFLESHYLAWNFLIWPFWDPLKEVTKTLDPEGDRDRAQTDPRQTPSWVVYKGPNEESATFKGSQKCQIRKFHAK